MMRFAVTTGGYMKGIRLVALGAAFAIGAGSAIEVEAQAAPAPQVGAERAAKARGERGQGRAMGGLVRDIELTDAQRAQVKAIHERYRPQMQALRPQGQRVRGDSAVRPDSAKRAEARAIMTRQQAEIRAVLTPGQQTTYDRNLAQMKERMERRLSEDGEGKRGRGKGARRGGRSSAR